jgi:hypothetical protein
LNVDDPLDYIRYIAKTQDSNPTFQSMVKRSAEKRQAAGKAGPNLIMVNAGGAAHRHVIVVAIAENESSHAALELVNSLVWG